MITRDGHIHVLPIHVANKIAAGEVVERPASVVKELLENSIDAGAKSIKVMIEQGGRKSISVSDDGVGMTKDDALLSLERQATSKILDVDDIEKIDTLGFRGEAIPSIASVSRFSMTTRRHDSDEATTLTVNAGVLVKIGIAGSPPGTIIEVKDLFCNVPARRKFLKSIATEESHIRRIVTVHALAHPDIAFTLIVDGREVLRLSPASKIEDRILDLFGGETVEAMLPIRQSETGDIKVFGSIEKPNLTIPTRHDQYVFINGRPATAPAIQYALKEAYPSSLRDVKPAAVLFITLPPTQVDVNVHPTKREVRFRDNGAVKRAVMEAVSSAITFKPTLPKIEEQPKFEAREPEFTTPTPPSPAPVAMEFALDGESTETKPWKWFKYLATTDSGFLLIETDSGLVTVHPIAARERITFEKLLAAESSPSSQALLIPEIIKLSSVDYARIKASLKEIRAMGFQIEEFGDDTFKVDAVPQLIDTLSPRGVLETLANDLADSSARRGDKWREELIAKSVSSSHARAINNLDKKGAESLIEELSACKMPYICPRGKPVMIFTSTRELNRKFNRD